MAGLKVNQLPEEVDLTLEKSTISVDSNGKARRTTFQAIRDLILGAVFWFKNDPDQIVTNQIIPNSNGRGYDFNATEPLSSIDANGLGQGDMVWVLLDKAGLEVSHNATTTGTFAPLWLMSTANYTSSKREQFCFRLWNTSDGLLWVEVTNSSIAGAVTPDDYTAEKSAQSGVVVQINSKITGFQGSEAANATTYGTATFIEENGLLKCTGAGVLTSVKSGVLEISFGGNLDTFDSNYLGISTIGRKFHVTGVTGTGVADNALYLEHFNGFINLGLDKIIVGINLVEI